MVKDNMSLYIGSQRVCPLKVIAGSGSSVYIGYLEDIKTTLGNLGISLGDDYSTYASTIASSYNDILNELQSISGNSSST